MDGKIFDAWTRRRFGLVAGGLTASLLGMVQRENAEAGQCKDLREKCGKRKTCCKKKNLKCGKVNDDLENKRCCRPVQGRCEDANECCGGGTLICDNIAGKDPEKTFCCGATGRKCEVDDDCCEGFECTYTKEAGYICF
jgi:hypothetical protein